MTPTSVAPEMKKVGVLFCCELAYLRGIRVAKEVFREAA